MPATRPPSGAADARVHLDPLGPRRDRTFVAPQSLISIACPAQKHEISAVDRVAKDYWRASR